MKASELRIGNLVWAPTLKANRVVDCLDIRDLHEGRLFQPFEPIPLSEEWLLKFGFEKEGYSEANNFYKSGFDQLSDYGGTSVVVPFNGNPAYLRCGYYENIIDCEYVHQLQNLYFALTGEELTIKVSS